MNKETQEFKAVLDMVPIDKEKKENILKHSEVFFEYRNFLKDKHGLSDEAVEKMTNDYVQGRLTEEEAGKVFGGDFEPVCRYAQQQATEEGFDKPIQESMQVFMDFYKSLSSGQF
jgi:hypothetical protein